MLAPSTPRPIPQRAAFSVVEAAQLLSISRAQIYRLNRADQIRFVKLGHRTLVPADEIDRLTAGRAA